MNVLPLFAEFMGTFALLLSIFATGNAFVIGGTLAAIILLIGGVSGAHVNPAVSMAMLFKGAISMSEFVGYSVMQMAGAIAAFYAYAALA